MKSIIGITAARDRWLQVHWSHCQCFECEVVQLSTHMLVSSAPQWLHHTLYHKRHVVAKFPPQPLVVFNSLSLCSCFLSINQSLSLNFLNFFLLLEMLCSHKSFFLLLSFLEFKYLLMIVPKQLMEIQFHPPLPEDLQHLVTFRKNSIF